ncbi:MAG: Gfo/Idh/MocA family oxidoreductase [Firmicutes bacterium]|nr:Gfo/Idh/MocA family oxidoreductase [Bacillota bacterium]
MAKVSILQVGIGGYGDRYSGELLRHNHEGNYVLAGAVDPAPERSRHLAELERLAVPIFHSMEEFYAQGTADLAIIASPLQFHSVQTIFALEHGSNVLCEKPVSVTVEQASAMRQARDKAGKFVGIGYQWSFSEAITALKREIIAGKLGRPRRLKTMVSWPRSFAYFQRSNWAGRIRAQNGDLILDSVANNATAHFLHNMFYVLGDRFDRSAVPVELEVELYRAYQIENYDTAAFRAKTREGVEILFLATHASREECGPAFCFEFEQATVYYDAEQEKEIKAVFKDGRVKTYGDPFADYFQKLWTCVAAVTDGRPLPCGIEAALPHTICINGAQQAEINPFPAAWIAQDEQRLYVPGLEVVLKDCYERFQLPSETGAGWVRPATKVNLQNYLSKLGW